MKNKRSDETRKKILDEGIRLWPNLTAREIARNINMTHPVIRYQFGDKLVDAVAAYAVEIGNSRVIAQLIATNHKAVKKMNSFDRVKHLNAVS